MDSLFYICLIKKQITMSKLREIRKAIDKASEQYLRNWRKFNHSLSNPIQAEAMKNNFVAGALWQLEESKMETYLLCFEAYKVSNTTHTDEETLFVEFNNWYHNQII
jgi:hypothetical protein